MSRYRMQWATLVGSMLGIGFALGLVLSQGGCAHSERPQCSDAALAKIEAAYVAEAVQACAGYTYETCPVLPEIRRKYAEKRKEWIRCQ